MPDTATKQPSKQLLHLVFGGELDNLQSVEFKDLDKLDIVGIYPNYASAYAAWKAKAQGTVDNAADALFHRPSAPAARSGHRRRSAERTYAAVEEHRATDDGRRSTVGVAAAEYLRFVGTTSRFTFEPPDIYERLEARQAGHPRHLARPAPSCAVRSQARTIRSRC